MVPDMLPSWLGKAAAPVEGGEGLGPAPRESPGGALALGLAQCWLLQPSREFSLILIQINGSWKGDLSGMSVKMPLAWPQCPPGTVHQHGWAGVFFFFFTSNTVMGTSEMCQALTVRC